MKKLSLITGGLVIFLLGLSAQSVKRIVVAEKVVANWCGNCVRGMHAVDYMKEKYPDSFIAIAVHTYNDPMEDEYYHTSLNPPTLPRVLVNRTGSFIDPNAGDLEKAYLEQSRKEAIASIAMEVQYTNTGRSEITAKIISQFVSSTENADYAIALVVTENNVRGESPLYDQRNYYANGALGVMGGFELLPDPIPATEIAYQDVSRGIFPEYKGIPNSLPTQIIAGEKYAYSYTFDLPSSILNKDEIDIIALLINRTTGEICNASKVQSDELSIVSNQSVKNSGYQVYANKEIIYIQSPESKSYGIKIYDTNGRLCVQQQIKDQTASIPVHTGKGIYFIHIHEGNSIVVKKILLK